LTCVLVVEDDPRIQWMIADVQGSRANATTTRTTPHRTLTNV